MTENAPPILSHSAQPSIILPEIMPLMQAACQARLVCYSCALVSVGLLQAIDCLLRPEAHVLARHKGSNR